MTIPQTDELSQLRDWRADVTSALGRPGGAFYEDVPKHVRKLRSDLENVRHACMTIMRGFDQGVFVRSTERDQNPKWAIELLPYIQALKALHEEAQKTLPHVIPCDGFFLDHPAGSFPDAVQVRCEREAGHQGPCCSQAELRLNATLDSIAGGPVGPAPTLTAATATTIAPSNKHPDLKACPFCNGSAVICELRDEINMGGFIVMCEVCQVNTRVFFPIKEDVTQALLGAWNVRVGSLDDSKGEISADYYENL